ncbi:MAG: HPr family phosphocarrier protein [Candidatus Omnitrophica bacterium]|nr:HPr family phosphocarrier protein [Candidatus Omnitrophota bacterium]
MNKIEEEIIIANNHGLHARPAAMFVQIANKFDSRVVIEKDAEIVDGKSIIAILSLGVNTGMKIKLVIEGSDASEAFNELKTFLENNND